jgi:hypothetical protein
MWEPNTIEAGLIATGVTLIGILITNQAKVSDFRQQWINALREDAATLVTHTFVVYSAKAGENIDDSYIQLNQVSARIRLRLNPKEKDTDAIITAMNKMRDANHSSVDFTKLTEYVNEFVAAIHKVLKKEWRRVKFGEPLYRIVFAAVMLGLLFFAIGVVRQTSIVNVEGKSSKIDNGEC